MPGDTMSDEEYGRRWAAQMGRQPYPIPDGDGFHVWHWDTLTTRPSRLPAVLGSILYDGIVSCSGHHTEADAYAALGRAVRAVHVAVPTLKGNAHAPGDAVRAAAVRLRESALAWLGCQDPEDCDADHVAHWRDQIVVADAVLAAEPPHREDADAR